MANIVIDTSASAYPRKYRSMSQSPRPTGVTIRRNFSDEPPTPDEPKDVWSNHNNNDSFLTLGSKDDQRRRSFQKFLDNNPHIARKRSERLADGSYQTTIQVNRTERAPSPFHISYNASAAAAAAAAAAATAKSTATAAVSKPVSTSTLTAAEAVKTSVPVNFSSNFHERGKDPTHYATDSTVASQTPVPASASSPLMSNEQIFLSMDANRDGLISWSEFLSYLNQSEARNGVYQARSRRSSMGKGFNASTKLHRRLALRKFFNRLDVSEDGYVSLSELCRGLDEQPELRAFLDSTSLRAMAAHRPSQFF